MRFISKTDIEDLTLNTLPIRKGCDNIWGCACLGICQQILAYISREEYNQEKDDKFFQELLESKRR
jgi:hypothetical protein